jgi:toxin-antitoxin system PIN domain toxin
LILVDANLLIYAYNPSLERHETARNWLERILNRPEPLRLAWVTLLAFLRISTDPRAFEHPLTVGEAVPIVSEWLARPIVGVLGPGDRHWEILSELLTRTGARGPDVMDAHLAALAIEHGATLATTDRGFVRFPGLRTVNPLEARD